MYEPTNYDQHTEDARHVGDWPGDEPTDCLGCHRRLLGVAGCAECIYGDADEQEEDDEREDNHHEL